MEKKVEISLYTNVIMLITIKLLRNKTKCNRGVEFGLRNKKRTPNALRDGPGRNGGWPREKWLSHASLLGRDGSIGALYSRWECRFPFCEF